MLSAVVITRNEEENIGRCLSSLSFADEVLVVDSGSTDKTTTIAKQYGAKVFHNKWSGYGSQKNFAAGKSSGDWLLFIDADEKVPVALSESINSIINDGSNNTTHDFYWLRIVTVFLNKPLYHLFGHNPRLYRRKAGCWTNASVHEQVVTNDGHLIKLGDNQSGLLIKPLLHYSHKTISSYIKKMHQYTSLDAKQMNLTGKHRSGKKVRPSIILPLKLSAKQFIKLLMYKRGFLDGIPGIIWCTLSSYYEFEMAIKYIKLTQEKSS